MLHRESLVFWAENVIGLKEMKKILVALLLLLGIGGGQEQKIAGKKVEIPAITKPKLVTVAEANKWLKKSDLVVGIDYQGEHRAYPVKILNWHEVVNDTMGGEKLVVIYSTLCGGGGVYKRGERIFGVSGKLKNSCTVLIDEKDKTEWDIWGRTNGDSLEPVKSDVMTWGEWSGAHVQTLVLSKETGFVRDYETYPYGTYETDQAIYFPVTDDGKALAHPKTIVWGVVIGEEARAYSWKAIKEETSWDSVLYDQVGKAKIRLSYNNGEIWVENLSTKQEVLAKRLYWFAWKANYPNSTISSVKDGEKK